MCYAFPGFRWWIFWYIEHLNLTHQSNAKQILLAFYASSLFNSGIIISIKRPPLVRNTNNEHRENTTMQEETKKQQEKSTNYKVPFYLRDTCVAEKRGKWSNVAQRWLHLTQRWCWDTLVSRERGDIGVESGDTRIHHHWYNYNSVGFSYTARSPYNLPNLLDLPTGL